MTGGTASARTVAVTGANGFIGSRLVDHLATMPSIATVPLTRADGAAGLAAALARADVVAHVAGVTRPRTHDEFASGNRQLTHTLADAVRATGRTPLVLFTSTVRATEDTEYGRTKRDAEDALAALADDSGCAVVVFRLPQVFGQGARPYYNAISATLLADAARGIATSLQRPDDPIELIDVGDVVAAFGAAIAAAPPRPGSVTLAPVGPSYRTTVGGLGAIAAHFGRGGTPDLGDPMQVALYAAFRGYPAI